MAIEPGDCIALMADNGLAAYTAYFAAAGIGAVLAPLNTRLHPREQAEVLNKASAKLVLCSSSHRDAVAQFERPVLELTDDVEATGQEDGWTTFVPASVSAAQTAHLYFTSGTTGAPKGVMLTHGNVATHARLACEALDIQGHDRWGHIAPMFHLADAWAIFAITRAGGSHVAMPRFSATHALRLLREQRVTITNLVPTMLGSMLEESPAADGPFPALRLVLSGGAPIAPATVVRVLKEFHPADYAQTYGLTETSPYLTLSCVDAQIATRSEEAQLAFRCRTGRPMPGVALRVVDDAGQLVPCDDAAVGEIQVCGPTVTPGYFEDAAATEQAFTDDGWFRTGDLATIDADGSVRIVDRKKDVILTGGETVYSIEVENALYAHPAVWAAAVFGLPDPKWGEAVTAAVVLDGDVDAAWEAALREHCVARLTKYKCPKEYHRVEELPKGGSGKVQKRVLIERFEIER